MVQDSDPLYALKIRMSLHTRTLTTLHPTLSVDSKCTFYDFIEDGSSKSWEDGKLKEDKVEVWRVSWKRDGERELTFD